MILRYAVVPALALLAVSCGKQEASPVAETPAEPQSVLVAKATRESLSGSITLTGEFIPYQDVDVLAKVTGYVREVRVDVGDRVKAGQVLATLEIPEMDNDLTRAQAAIEQADAETAKAQDDIRRTESAQGMTHLSLTRIGNVATKEPGLVPQQEVDEARARDLQAEAQVAGAKSNLLAAQKSANVLRADLARLKTMQQYETIVAPFDGVITKRYASTGAMVQSTPVVRVSQNNLLRLVLPVPESAVAQVAIGKKVTVRVPSLDRTFEGLVARFTDTLQLATRTMDTEVEVPNPSLTLIPGMYAMVELQLAQKDGVAVPLDAIDGSGAGAKVFLVTGENTLHIVPVKVGLQTPERAGIEQGIREGDVLVVGRHTGLKEGDRVKTVAR